MVFLWGSVFTQAMHSLTLGASKWMSLAALKEEMAMKEQFLKWISFLALMAFVTAVFMIVDGCYWLGIILIGAGAGFASLAAKKKDNDSNEEQETK